MSRCSLSTALTRAAAAATSRPSASGTSSAATAPSAASSSDGDREARDCGSDVTTMALSHSR